MFKRVMVAVIGIPALILILGFASPGATVLLTMSLWRFTPHFSLSGPRPSTQNTAVQVKMR